MNARTPIALLVALAFAAPLSAAPVIVNEINAGADGVDRDWFELVVVGDGTAGSTVDMRGWSLRVDNNGATGAGMITLSQDTYWSNVLAGTILTFIEDDVAPNGTPTSILGTNNFSTLGWAHTNVWAGDVTYVDTAAIDHDPNWPIDQTNTQIAIFDALDAPVFGPAGEGHAGYPGGGVSGTEVFKLEADPSPSIALTSPYNDGATATFGAPNAWSGGATTQSFVAYVIPEPNSALSLLAAIAAIGLSTRARRRREV